MKKIIFGALLAVTASFSFAQNPLSVHVLNQETGLPSANVAVILEAQQGDKWIKLNELKQMLMAVLKSFILKILLYRRHL